MGNIQKIKDSKILSYRWEDAKVSYAIILQWSLEILLLKLILGEWWIISWIGDNRVSKLVFWICPLQLHGRFYSVHYFSE